ncbi:type II toxin-antitoxin system RatA family toxin [Gallaecimonas sp. GXIMD4217]|uniref:type II toxin-antitoxin system RatA family toxin n=1 Tax=Gallaecimonas sp. GXIMD4217 TaxID=3131927 RepID=UPI00311AD1EC
MPVIRRQADVPYSPAQMYALVNDVPSYPAFLPGCVATRVLNRSDKAMTATVEVAKGPIRKAFTTRNSLVADERIDMELVNGPFRYLRGCWHFLPKGGGCTVQLELDFAFSSPLVAMAFGGIFEQLTKAMVGAFSQRAREVYGD